MNIVERAKAIILKPKETWEIIKAEQTTVRELFTSYAAVLAVIPAAATFIGFSLVGYSLPVGHYRVPVLSGLVHAILQYVLTLVGAYAVAFIIDALAPKFDSRKDLTAAAKLAVFAATPAWVGGALAILPALSPLILIASLYSLYLFYIGLPVMMETPKEKTLVYFIVVIIASIVVSMIIGAFSGSAVQRPLSMMP